MAITNKNQLQEYFKTGKKPTQQQFWDWLDSFYHKNEELPGKQNVYFGNELPANSSSYKLLDYYIITDTGNETGTIQNIYQWNGKKWKPSHPSIQEAIDNGNEATSYFTIKDINHNTTAEYSSRGIYICEGDIESNYELAHLWMHDNGKSIIINPYSIELAGNWGIDFLIDTDRNIVGGSTDIKNAFNNWLGTITTPPSLQEITTGVNNNLTTHPIISHYDYGVLGYKKTILSGESGLFINAFTSKTDPLPSGSANVESNGLSIRGDYQLNNGTSTETRYSYDEIALKNDKFVLNVTDNTVSGSDTMKKAFNTWLGSSSTNTPTIQKVNDAGNVIMGQTQWGEKNNSNDLWTLIGGNTIELKQNENFTLFKIDAYNNIVTGTTSFKTAFNSWLGNDETEWQIPTLNYGIGNLGQGYSTVKYKRKGNEVRIEGVTNGGTSQTAGNNYVLFTLPEGFRPKETHIFPVMMFSTTTPAYSMGKIDIRPNGDVVGVVFNKSWTNLGNISFFTDEY